MKRKHVLEGDSWAINVFDKKGNRYYIKYKTPEIKNGRYSLNEIIVEISNKVKKVNTKLGIQKIFVDFTTITAYINRKKNSKIKVKNNKTDTVIEFPYKSIKKINNEQLGKIITGWQILNDIKRSILNSIEDDVYTQKTIII